MLDAATWKSPLPVALDSGAGTHARSAQMTAALAKYAKVFNIGAQNTFVYRWNFVLDRKSVV